MTRPQCYSCKHYLFFKKCKAFNTEIPDEIFTDEFDHTKPFKGDNGIRFEPIEE